MRRERSHTRIVEQAAKMIRERGIAGASVDEVMGAAGLTRGGFYAHFEDKTQLACEALQSAFEGAYENLFGSDMQLGPKAWRERAVKRYIAEAHIDDPGQGCAVPALGGEIARAEPAIRETTKREVGRVLEGIEAHIGGDPETARDRAIALFATCVGAITIARAVGDRAMQREIIAACRRELLRGDGDIEPVASLAADAE